MSRRILSSVAPVLFLMTQLGCGGDDEPVTTAPPPAPPPSAVPTAPSRPVAPVQAARPRPTPKQTAPSAAAKDSEPANDPNGYLVGGEHPNVTLLTDQHPPERTDYLAVAPTEGLNSASFRVAPPAPQTAAPGPSNDFSLPSGFTPAVESGYSEQGLPLRIECDKDGSQMALVESGVFTRGSEEGPGNASPTHPVYVSTFYMDVHETTLAQYNLFWQEQGRTRATEPSNVDNPPNHPVLGVTYRDALNYARWAGKEIPREAEWEYAARTARNFPYVWGFGRPFWTRLRSPGQIDPVGSFRNDRTSSGIYDLAGNAREWCTDWYAEDSYVKEKTPDGSPLRNPTGPDRPRPGSIRVIKGAGSVGWGAWHRDGEKMATSLPDVGMRFVLRLETPEDEEAADGDTGSRPNF